jgi:hypothetical protein
VAGTKGALQSSKNRALAEVLEGLGIARERAKVDRLRICGRGLGAAAAAFDCGVSPSTQVVFRRAAEQGRGTAFLADDSERVEEHDRILGATDDTLKAPGKRQASVESRP